ncbi:MAG: lysozyme inhibitor LprI family protein [Pyrinomonadaceae bacterium]
MTSLYILLLILFSASVVCPQEQSTHPIDKALDACIEKDGSTAGMIRCTDKAYLAWDRQLNKNYADLMRRSKAGQEAALKAAQLQWLKYRDSEFKLIDSVYDALQGTMYLPMRISERLEIVKKRALSLRGYFELLEEGSP